MGLTASEYESKYGIPMDLSEKHLAWFSKTALPDVSDDYPYDSAQAGEGSPPQRCETKGNPVIPEEDI